MSWNATAASAMLKALALIAGVLVAAPAWPAPQVDVFTPQGQTKGVRQVAVRFTEPMVAFGDPRLPDPFAVRCAGDPERLKGRGRWADQNFRSCLTQSETYVLACYRYIELNPVRAAMVNRPQDYRWSSYHAKCPGQGRSVDRASRSVSASASG